MRLFLTVLFFGASLSFSVLADFRDGIDAFQSGHYEAAIREWQPCAAENDPRALYNLGQMYRRGLGVKLDISLAEQYYRRAAELGHPHAQGNLGSIYYSRSPADMERAIHFWSSAARGGDRKSQYLLGIQHFRGRYVEQNLFLAYAWVKLAVDSGLESARYALDVFSLSMREDGIKQGDELALQLSEAVRNQQRRSEKARRSGTLDTICKPDPVSGVFRIQIAALSDAEQAKSYWERESKKRGNMMGTSMYYITEADLGKRGIFYRLRFGNFAERDTASTLCEQLQETGLDCYVVSRSRMNAIPQAGG